jgi:hypothetical protein
MSDEKPTFSLDGGPLVPTEMVLQGLNAAHPDVLRSIYWRTAYVLQQQEAEQASGQNGPRPGGLHAPDDADRQAAVPGGD